MPKRDGGLSVLMESKRSRPALGEEGHEDILYPVSRYRMQTWEKDGTDIWGNHSSSDFVFTSQEMASTFSHISFIWLSSILNNQHVHSPQKFKPEHPNLLQEEVNSCAYCAQVLTEEIQGIEATHNSEDIRNVDIKSVVLLVILHCVKV